jgi:phosphoglycerate kinase
MKKLTLRDISVANRLRLKDQGARTILMSHLGRPKKGPDPSLSLAPAAVRLSELLGSPVAFAADCVGPPAETAAGKLHSGEILLLENLRFHPEEEANDPAFAARLASLGDCYVNDAFGSAHRAHASTEGVTHFLTPCVAGFLMEKELASLGDALDEPKRPFVAVLGGAKVSGKIDVIEHLLPRVDSLLIGGAMTFTFFRAQGIGTGRSLVEEDRIAVASAILTKAKEAHLDLRLPSDIRVSSSADGTDEGRIVGSDAIPPEEMGVDIGPATVDAYSAVLREAGTVLWNGPMGVFEVPPFAVGTIRMAQAMAEATRRGAITVVGGGDSAAAIVEAGLEDAVTHVSTGGGASLEFLEGKTLPGVAALDDRED